MGVTTISIALRALCIIGLLVRAAKHKSLTQSGLIAAVVTGVIHACTPSIVNLAMLMAFFASGTSFTKYKLAEKAKLTQRLSLASQTLDQGLDHEAEVQEPRNHVQVIANSGVACVLCLILLVWPDSKVVQFAIASHYAAVTADTWSSELGILSKSGTFLITTMRPCPKGVNGGVSLFGLVAATAGGLFIGIVTLVCRSSFYQDLTMSYQLGVVILIAACGLMGSLADSMIGASLQRTVVNTRTGHIVEVDGGYRLPGKMSADYSDSYKTYTGADVLSNNQVNLVMAAISALNGMILGSACF